LFHIGGKLANTDKYEYETLV